MESGLSVRREPSSPSGEVISPASNTEDLDQTGSTEGMGIQLEHGNQKKGMLQVQPETDTQSLTPTREAEQTPQLPFDSDANRKDRTKGFPPSERSPRYHAPALRLWRGLRDGDACANEM